MERKNLIPPKEVRDAARQGLKWHDQNLSREHLMPMTLPKARSLARGEMQTRETLRRMKDWFEWRGSPHNIKDKFRETPTPELVEWNLWGGDAGKDWADEVIAKMDLEG